MNKVQKQYRVSSLLLKETPNKKCIVHESKKHNHRLKFGDTCEKAECYAVTVKQANFVQVSM